MVQTKFPASRDAPTHMVDYEGVVPLQMQGVDQIRTTSRPRMVDYEGFVPPEIQGVNLVDFSQLLCVFVI